LAELGLIAGTAIRRTRSFERNPWNVIDVFVRRDISANY
jgi:hypothetical protein